MKQLLLPVSEQEGWPWQPAEIPFELPGVLPKISIVTPSFNQGCYLEETIRSVLLPGYPNLEYIIVDGGSHDNSTAIIEKYSPWLTYWVSEPDRGQSHAINKGFSHATGEWIAWLNSDDLYLPATLWMVAKTILDFPHTDWIAGTTLMFSNRLEVTGQFKPLHNSYSRQGNQFVTNTWLDFVCTKKTGTAIPQPSSFWSRKAWMASGGYIDETYHYTMDHEYYVRLAKQGYSPLRIDEPLAYFRKYPEQKSSKNLILTLDAEVRVAEYWEGVTVGKEKKLLEKYIRFLNRIITNKKVELFLQRFLIVRYYFRIKLEIRKFIQKNSERK